MEAMNLDGPENPKGGIFGCGGSSQLALGGCDKHLKEHLESHAEDDALAAFNWVRW